MPGAYRAYGIVELATRPYHRSDRNLIEKLIEAAERYARIREINSGHLVQDGMLGLTDIRKEERAREAYISARAELRERFPSAAERLVAGQGHGPIAAANAR